jgi:hypothetical protein
MFVGQRRGSGGQTQSQVLQVLGGRACLPGRRRAQTEKPLGSDFFSRSSQFEKSEAVAGSAGADGSRRCQLSNIFSGSWRFGSSADFVQSSFVRQTVIPASSSDFSPTVVELTAYFRSTDRFRSHDFVESTRLARSLGPTASSELVATGEMKTTASFEGTFGRDSSHDFTRTGNGDPSDPFISTASIEDSMKFSDTQKIKFRD